MFFSLLKSKQPPTPQFLGKGNISVERKTPTRFCRLRRIWARHKLKIIVLLFFIIVIVGVFATTVFGGNNTGGQSVNVNSDVQQDFNRGIEDILNELDLASLEEWVNAFSPEQLAVFGQASVLERVRMVISGEISVDSGGFFRYLMQVIGINLVGFLPFILGVLAIAISINIVHSLKGKMASESVGNIVSFVGVALVATILAVQLMAVLLAASNMLTSLTRQMNTAFPILLTLMAGAGAMRSAAVYQPAVAILGNGIMTLISVAIIPIFIVTNVFTVVGNLSDTVRLKKMGNFFSSSAKWILGTAFFLFIAFLSVQGITAAIHDGVSVRTARFAINRYVPVIGGYLSEGFNLIMAGSSLVKNAIGFTAVLVLFLTVLPVIAQTIIFSLSLKMAGAIAEPLGEKRISDILSGVGKNMGTLIAVLIGAVFLYFVFLMLVIATGNPSL